MTTLPLTIFDHDNRVLVHRITELQKGWCSKGPLELTLSNFPPQAGPHTACCTVLCPDGLWIWKSLSLPAQLLLSLSHLHKRWWPACSSCFGLCPLTLILSLDATKRNLALFLHPPFTYLYTLMRFPWSHLFSRLNISSIQAFSHGRDSTIP